MNVELKVHTTVFQTFRCESDLKVMRKTQDHLTIWETAARHQDQSPFINCIC